MDSMSIVIVRNIKRLREEKKLSMDELVKLNGVSKSMLAQIERGDGNPTISTLWKVSNGMGVPLDILTARPKSSCEIIKKTKIQPLLEGGEKVKSFSLFPGNGNRRFTVYYLELDQGGYWESKPHLRGTTEFITISRNKIEIYVSSQGPITEGGKSICFRADIDHSYKSVESGSTISHMILFNL